MLALRQLLRTARGGGGGPNKSFDAIGGSVKARMKG